MEPYEVKQKQVLYEEGSLKDNIFIVQEGEFEITKKINVS